MLINQRCTTCSDDVSEAEITICETCGGALHEDCADYETTFECETCGDDPAIGALEF